MKKSTVGIGVIALAAGIYAGGLGSDPNVEAYPAVKESARTFEDNAGTTSEATAGSADRPVLPDGWTEQGSDLPAGRSYIEVGTELTGALASAPSTPIELVSGGPSGRAAVDASPKHSPSPVSRLSREVAGRTVLLAVRRGSRLIFLEMGTGGEEEGLEGTWSTLDCSEEMILDVSKPVGSSGGVRGIGLLRGTGSWEAAPVVPQQGCEASHGFRWPTDGRDQRTVDVEGDRWEWRLGRGVSMRPRSPERERWEIQDAGARIVGAFHRRSVWEVWISATTDAGQKFVRIVRQEDGSWDADAPIALSK